MPTVAVECDPLLLLLYTASPGTERDPLACGAIGFPHHTSVSVGEQSRPSPDESFRG